MKLDPIAGKANSNLYRHPGTGIIYIRMSKAGKGRIEKSTGTDNLGEARRIADEIRYKFLGRSNPKQGRRLCGELFPEWLEQKSYTTRPATIASIQASWKHLKPFISGMLPEEITAKWWEATYIPEKRKETHKARKFFNDRKWLSMFLLSLKREGLIDTTPDLINPDPERAAGKVYTDDEVESLLNFADEDLHLHILMAATQGMRLSEILLLAWERVDVPRGTIHLRAEDTKIKKARTFAMSKQVLSIIQKRVERGDPKKSPFLFPHRDDPRKPRRRDGFKTAWKFCQKNALVSGRFHDLRHTFLTKAFKAPNANAALICHYAGLSLDEAQKTYLHFTVDDTRQVAELVRFE